MSENVLLKVEDLHVNFPIPRGVIGTVLRHDRQDVRAVDGISLQLAAGELVALVGESGCGKTTTAQTVIRMVDPTSGTIAFQGTDITTLSANQMRPMRRHMQIIYQDPYESLDPRFRVRQTIEEPMIVHGVGGTKAERVAKIDEALTRAGLTPPELYRDRFAHELSGGQRQRVAIAASLVLDPKFLIADEPVSMLDVSVRAGVLSLLDGLRRDGLGILMITHDLSTAAHFADRIAVMYLGRIVEEGPAKEVVRDPRHPYTKALLSVVPKPDPRDNAAAQILTGETPDAANIPTGCRFRPRCPAVTDACAHTDPTLQTPTVEGPVSQGHRAACILA